MMTNQKEYRRKKLIKVCGSQFHVKSPVTLNIKNNSSREMGLEHLEQGRNKT